MRILHVLDHSVPLHSGYSFRTLSIVREQECLGWTPLLLTGPKQNSGAVTGEDVDGRHFFRTPLVARQWMRHSPVKELIFMRALERRIRELISLLKPDLIHAHSPVLDALPALRAARSAGLPLVYEVRAFWEDAAVEHGTQRANGARYRATRALETFALKKADAVTTICDGLRREIISRGIAENGVTEIPNAVDLRQFTYDPHPDDALRRTLGLENHLVLGFVGSFYRYEGLDILLEALALLRQQSWNVKLLLVGGGPEERRLRDLCEKRALNGSVLFTGRVPNEQVSNYYSVIDWLVYPRLRHRLTELVTPLKPLEAMAQGKLVVASDVGGHRELIRHDHTGFLFTPESAEALAACLDRIRARRESLRSVQEAARRFVETQRTWRSSVARYQAVYDAVLRHSARDGGLHPSRAAQ